MKNILKKIFNILNQKNEEHYLLIKIYWKRNIIEKEISEFVLENICSQKNLKKKIK